MSKRGPGEVTNKERGAPAGGEPHPERAEPLLVREEPRPHPQEGINGDESAKDMPDVVNVLQKTWQETAAAAGVVTMVREECARRGDTSEPFKSCREEFEEENPVAI